MAPESSGWASPEVPDAFEAVAPGTHDKRNSGRQQCGTAGRQIVGEQFEAVNPGKVLDSGDELSPTWPPALLIMVHSRIPVAQLANPYPGGAGKAWFTSPMRPTSSPMARCEVAG
jgi:hypothetical protein